MKAMRTITDEGVEFTSDTDEILVLRFRDFETGDKMRRAAEKWEKGLNANPP